MPQHCICFLTLDCFVLYRFFFKKRTSLGNNLCVNRKQLLPERDKCKDAFEITSVFLQLAAKQKIWETLFLAQKLNCNFKRFCFGPLQSADFLSQPFNLKVFAKHYWYLRIRVWTKKTSIYQLIHIKSQRIGFLSIEKKAWNS